jgi:hypothetical protein
VSTSGIRAESAWIAVVADKNIQPREDDFNGDTDKKLIEIR